MNRKYQICVVIINYNSAHYTISCIESVFRETDKNIEFQIVVVDNNSDFQDLNKLKLNLRQFPEIQLIESKFNSGFSGGNMLGVQFSNADYIFFLNNDTVLLNDNLSIFLNFMKTTPAAGICTGQMYNTDKTFHHSFGYFPDLKFRIFGSSFLRMLNPARFPSKKQHFQTPLKVDFCTGAAMFVDFLKFAAIGGFDTNYFLYCEEEDIAQKMRNAGFETYLVPQAEFIHHMGKSTTRNLAIEQEFYISRLYYHRKYSNRLSYLVHKFLYFVKNIKKFYKNFMYIRLAIFILGGARMKHSMRHRQKIG